MKRALILALMLAAAPADAHRLKLFVTAEGPDLVGTAYFAGGGKAAGIEGRVTAPDGRELARFRTDAEGGFRVAAPAEAVVQVDGGDGHAASTALAPEPAAPSDSTGEIEQAVARQIRPLRAQIDAMESRARFSDIMGGIGTIFGIFGIAAWIAAQRKARP